MALNPDMFMEHSEFQSRLERYVEMFYAAEPVDADTRLYLPGELEFLTEQENMKNGIPIDVNSVEKLRKLSSERGVPCPL